MIVKISDLESVATKALKHYGYSDEEIGYMLPVMMYAQLRGNNQGLIKLLDNNIPKNPKATPIKVIKETKLSAIIDGGMNFSMISMTMATHMAIKKAKKHGFGIVGTNNTVTSTGAQGYYSSQIAKAGFIGFTFTQVRPMVAAYGSSEAIYGTNPLSIAVPADPEPIVLDMSTAAMAFYGFLEAKTAGKQVAEGLGYDNNGNPTTDPGKVLNGGAIKGFGGYKGSGLAFMIEVLAGPLVGASFAGIGERGDWGNLTMALDPELLTDRKTFKANVTKLALKVKSTRKLPGVQELYMPGERSTKRAQNHVQSGTIEIENNLYNKLKKIANRLLL
jgi:LDH2 family malate/lactate/ureidoglycolate dehydrogenase